MCKLYHKTNNRIVSTCVMLGFIKDNITHGNHVWDKHKEMVSKLENDGDVLVTGGTFVGAKYSGFCWS